MLLLTAEDFTMSNNLERGEFLTHVWLLMVHLGITEQLQVSHGDARAKISVL